MKLQINFETGAKEVLDRVIEAYGFKTKLALADHLGIASSSLANRYTRGYFPSDIVVKCMAETGATLEWLATGRGKANDDSQKVNLLDRTSLERKVLNGGSLRVLDTVSIDSSLLTYFSVPLVNPSIIIEGSTQYVADFGASDLFDGLWLISIEGSHSIKKVTRLPGSRLKVSAGNESFECAQSDIEIVAFLPISLSLTGTFSL